MKIRVDKVVPVEPEPPRPISDLDPFQAQALAEQRGERRVHRDSPRVNIYIDKEAHSIIEKYRGGLSRSEFIRAVLREHARRREHR